MPTSMPIFNDLSVRSRGGSVDNVKSDFLILVELGVSVQQDVKLGSILCRRMVMLNGRMTYHDIE